MYISATRLDNLRVQFEAKFTEALLTTDTWADRLATRIPSDTESNLYGFVENELQIREWIGEREAQALEESDYRLTNKHFESTVALDRDKLSDDKLGLFTTVTVPMLGVRVAKWDDLQLVDIMLNNAVDYNGENFFDPNNSNSHSMALTPDNFSDVRAKMLTQTDLTGAVRYIGNQFDLVVPPQLESMARNIVESEWNSYGTQTAGTDGIATEHGTNVRKGQAQVVVIPELTTNPNRWGLFATGLPIKALIVQDREAPEFVVLDNKQQGGSPFYANKNVYGVDFRRAYGVSFPWLAHMSDPDGAMT